jgi:hypothetical protein
LMYAYQAYRTRKRAGLLWIRAISSK